MSIGGLAFPGPCTQSIESTLTITSISFTVNYSRSGSGVLTWATILSKPDGTVSASDGYTASINLTRIPVTSPLAGNTFWVVQNGCCGDWQIIISGDVNFTLVRQSGGADWDCEGADVGSGSGSDDIQGSITFGDISSINGIIVSAGITLFTGSTSGGWPTFKASDPSLCGTNPGFSEHVGILCLNNQVTLSQAVSLTNPSGSYSAVNNESESRTFVAPDPVNSNSLDEHCVAQTTITVVIG